MSLIDEAISLRQSAGADDSRVLQTRASRLEVVLLLDQTAEFERAEAEARNLLALPALARVESVHLRVLTAAIGLALRRGDGGAARAWAQRAQALVEQVEPIDPRLRGEIALARVQGLTGGRADQAAAFARLHEVQRKAATGPLPLIVDEAELALGEIELAKLDSAIGRSRLRTLASEAEAAGRRALAAQARRLAVS